jgi:hypothetical protein
VVAIAAASTDYIDRSGKPPEPLLDDGASQSRGRRALGARSATIARA